MLENIFKITFAFGFLLLVLGWFGYMFGGGSKVYVAVLLPEHDGSGKTKVIGAFRKKEKAESMIYQHVHGSGYLPPSTVIECVINKDMIAEDW